MHSNSFSTRLHGVLVGALLVVCALGASPASAQTGSKPFTASEMREHSVTLEQPTPQDYAKPRLRRAGMVLTISGVAGFVLGAGLMASQAGCSGDLCGFGMAGGVGVAGLGSLFMIIGIPMWVAGSRRAEPAGAARLLPSSLSLGAGSASARWEF